MNVPKEKEKTELHVNAIYSNEQKENTLFLFCDLPEDQFAMT